MRFLMFYSERTEAEVARMVAGVEDMRKPPDYAERQKVARAIRNQYAKAFDKQGPVGGAPWARLAPSTVRERVRLGFGGERPILIRTGRYRKSWVDKYSPDHIEDLQTTGSGWQLVVGSEDYRAVFHERGTYRMPARPIRVSVAGNEEIANVVRELYDSRWRKATR